MREIPLYDNFVLILTQVSAFSNNWRQHAKGHRSDPVWPLPCPSILLERRLYIQNKIQTKVLAQNNIWVTKMLKTSSSE